MSEINIQTQPVTDECTENVMRRVRRIYVWKTFGKPFIIECTMLGSVIGGSAFLVSIKHIVENVSERETFIEVSQFVYSAFTHTELSTKALSLGALVLAGLITKDSIIAVARFIQRFRFGRVA
jgi:hypothetical protein